MRNADSDAVFLPHEPKLERATEEGEKMILCERSVCINKIAQIPRSIAQLHKYFLKGKPKSSVGTIFTNCLILHNEDIDDIILDLKEGMSSNNPKIGKQRVQHHDAVKLGYVMCLTTKIELSRWTEFFEASAKHILNEKALLALSLAKVNDGTSFKDDASKKAASNHTRKKKVEYWGMHIEMIKSKQLKVKNAMSVIVKTIPKEMHGIELRFMPQMRYDMDSAHKQRLPNAMMKHRQVLANLVEFKLTDFEEIDAPIKSLEDKTIRQLIMDLKSKSGEKLCAAVEQAWNGELALWAKGSLRLKQKCMQRT